MGASHSTPPPLVEVNAPGGKVLVPPGTAFTVHPPSYARSRSDPYSRGPVYTPCSPNRRPRSGRRPRYGGPDIDILEDSEESGSTLTDVLEGMGPGGMRRQPSNAYPGNMMGGGGGMPGVGRRGGPAGFFDGMDARPRSAPEMQLGGYPGMMGGMPMGMPGSPGLGGMRGIGGMGGGMGAMGGRPPSGLPPEYTSNPAMPARFGGAGGGMQAPGMKPYSNHPGPASSQSTTSSPDAPPQTTRRPPFRRPKHYEHIPMGAYANAEKPRRPRADPQMSARLNRTQPSHTRVGPSGKEWIESDNAWLDACTCTTGCNCRKSHRVLYRAQNDAHQHHHGSDSDDEETQDHLRASGEIRYILKEDLGRDCGDHTACKKSSSSSGSDDSSCSSSSKNDKRSNKKTKKKKKKKKELLDKKQEKKQQAKLDTFKDDVLGAVDERLLHLGKDSRHQQQHHPIRRRDVSESSARQPFRGPNMGPPTFMMNNRGGGGGGGGGMDIDIDPRMAQHMGMMSGDAYGTGRMPPSMPMADPRGGKRGMMYPDMGMARGGGMGMGMGGGGFENDMLSDMDDMGLGMNVNMNRGNPYLHSGGGGGGGGGGIMGKNGMRHNYVSHRGAAGKAGRQFGNGGAGMDMDQMAAMYAKAMGGGGRGGVMMGGGGRGRRAQVDSSSDDFHLGPGPSMRSSGMRHQQQQASGGGGGGGGHDRAGRGSRRPGVHDKDSPIRRDFGASPLGARTNTGSLDRGKQARVDTDDDDAY